MEALSDSFRALGDPTRLRILRLVSQAPLNVSELVSLVGVSQSAVSHHLSRLRRMELIREDRQAGYTFYSLAVDGKDDRWPLIDLLRKSDGGDGDEARLRDLLRQREDRQALNERLLEPGQSWFLWAGALASLLPPLEVADFGCGTGALSASLARWAKRVVAIDQSHQALKKARERAKREGLKNIDFLQEDLHQLPLPAGGLDLVVISQSLHHTDQPAAVLREAARILKPDGRVVVLELMPHREEWVRERLGHKHLGFPPDGLSGELEEAGFSEVTCEIHGRDAAPAREGTFRVFLLTGVRR